MPKAIRLGVMGVPPAARLGVTGVPPAAHLGVIGVPRAVRLGVIGVPRTLCRGVIGVPCVRYPGRLGRAPEAPVAIFELNFAMCWPNLAPCCIFCRGSGGPAAASRIKAKCCK